MNLHSLRQQQDLPISIEQAWTFFSDARNLDAITPPELRFRILTRDIPPVHPGQIIAYRIRLAPMIWRSWVTEITHVDPGSAFVDEQRAGPYRFWHHRHAFEALNGGVRILDLVNYALPFGPLGTLAHALFVRQKLESIFDYRRRKLEEMFPTRT